jgi:hypothetical protein
VLGTGTPLGETYSALQSMALSLKERGILLCVSSKNDEAIALDAFRSHSEMVLKEQDIVVFRVNWDDKAANIKAISDTIDLGLDSFVFLDDNLPSASGCGMRCPRSRFPNCRKIPANGYRCCRPPDISSSRVFQGKTSFAPASTRPMRAAPHNWSGETILQHLVQQARAAGITDLIGRYIPTAKNGLVRDHFSKLGFTRTDAQPSGEPRGGWR